MAERLEWPEEADGLVALQERLRGWAAEAAAADPYRLGADSTVADRDRSGDSATTPTDGDSGRAGAAALIGGCFVAFARGEAGPGRPGDRAFAAAVVWEPGHEAVLRRRRGGLPAARSEARALRGTRRDRPRQAADVAEQAVVRAEVGAAYVPGLLALREGPALAAAVSALRRRPDVLLVDASGLDHPRRAGLAVHLGWALDLPTVGVTSRPLRAAPEGDQPAGESRAPGWRTVGAGGPMVEFGGLVRGWWAPLYLGGDVVAAWACTRTGARPVVAHAGWRTDVETAVAVVLAASTEGARAPVPLQESRRVAREARDLAGLG
jgi:deoxyribonuclease V